MSGWTLRNSDQKDVQVSYFGQKTLDTKSLIKRKVLTGEFLSDRNIGVDPNQPEYSWSLKRK